MSILIHIFVMLITYIMLPKENINVPEASESHLHGVGYKPLAGGTSYFTTMKMIEYLGVIPTRTGKSKFHQALYECPFCGTHFKAIIYQIDSGHTKSCGCLQKLSKMTFGLRMKKHALTSHPLYWVYTAMKQRCFNPKNKSYKDYGGRGITVCDEWKNNFKAFYEWANKNGYKKGLAIDRIENDEGYSPDNCRWAEKAISHSNTRLLKATNTTGYRGVSFRSKRNKKWESRITFNNQHIGLGHFATAIEAAQAYNHYVISNNLPHPLNKI